MKVREVGDMVGALKEFDIVILAIKNDKNGKNKRKKSKKIQREFF